MCQKILRLSLTTRRPRYSTVSHGTAQLLHGQKNTCLPLSTIGAREGHYICRVLFTVVGLTHVHKELPISHQPDTLDRKSTRLNSSHVSISYAVFCLKKKNHQH